MTTVIKTKNSTTTTSAPSSLAQGELAVNITDKKLWVGNASSTPVQIAGNGFSPSYGALTATSITDSGLTSGRVTYATTGGLLTDNANFVFDGTSLGVGTSSPAQKLHVASAGTTAIQVQNTASSGSAYFKATNTATTCSFGVDATGGYIETAGAYSTVFYTNSSERMRIDSSGNLGLGVTPSAWRSNYKAIQAGNGAVFSGANTSSTAWMGSNWYTNSGNTDTYIANGYASTYAQFSGTHVWYTAPSGTAGNAISFTQAMTLDASGNLALGTTTANQRLSVASSNPTNGYVAAIANSYNTTGRTGTYLLFDASGIADWKIGIPPDVNAWSIYDVLAGAERARIDTSGNLLVGCTSTPSSTVSGALIRSTSVGPSLFSVGTYTSSAAMIYFVNGNGTVGSITTNGSLTAYNISSDQRLKTDLGVSTDTSVIDNTIIHDFEWITDKIKSKGVFAQEAEKVKPEAVHKGTDELNEKGLPVNPWGVDYSKYIPDLIVYCQQLKAEINTLKAQLGAK